MQYNIYVGLETRIRQRRVDLCPFIECHWIINFALFNRIHFHAHFPKSKAFQTMLFTEYTSVKKRGGEAGTLGDEDMIEIEMQGLVFQNYYLG